jgi:undecaprenyl-diphosphatase
MRSIPAHFFTTARARLEALPLIAIAIVGGSVFAFIEIAEEVLENDTHAIDERVLLWLRNPSDPKDPLGPPWFEAMVGDITSLGSTFTLTFLTLAIGGLLLLAGRRNAGYLLFVSVAGGALLSSALKSLFDRPRPDLVAHGTVVFTASFPSGHAMLSAVTYLTLGALIMRISERWALKAYTLALCVLLTLLIGVSRVYLGVHWPTDVLAGWTVGAAWATLVWTIAIWLQRRGDIEPPV